MGQPLSPKEREAQNQEVGEESIPLNPEAPEFTIHHLPRATPGSAGLDLAALTDVILSNWDGIHLIPTSVLGVLPSRTVGLIIGRSSNYKKNFEVVPGIVDSDSLGEIKVMVKALKETVQLHKGQRIAQLLLLPYLHLPNPILKGERGKGQFGSTDTVAWVQEINDQRPFKNIIINGRSFNGLLDTGADKSCIAGKDWPSSWPVRRTSSTLQGLGMATDVAQSSQILKWKCEGKSGYVQPYVIASLPFSLWGRDIMEDMNVKLVTSDSLSWQNFS